MNSVYGDGISLETGAIPLGFSLLPQADEALRGLAERVGAGAAWDAAFDEYRTTAARADRLSILPPDGRINWSWLTDLTEAGSALDLGSPFGEVAANLALDFGSVGYIGAESVHGTLARHQLSERDGVRTVLCRSAPDDAAHAFDGQIDLASFIAAPGWRRRLPAGLDTPAGIVGFAAAALRPSGWLGLLVTNPYWHVELRRPGSGQLEALRVRSGFRRALRDHRFSETREYLVAHYLDLPSVYVPATRDAIRQYQIATHAVRGSRLAARAGLSATLFPARLILARR